MARFGAIRVYAVIVKVLSWLLLVGGIVGGGFAGLMASSTAPFLIGLAGGVAFWLGLQVVAQGLQLLLAVEDSTRRTAEALAAMQERTAAPVAD